MFLPPAVGLGSNGSQEVSISAEMGTDDSRLLGGFGLLRRHVENEVWIG